MAWRHNMIPSLTDPTQVKRARLETDTHIPDEEFEPQFLNEPYVFEGECEFRPNNSFVFDRSKGSVFFTKIVCGIQNSYSYRVEIDLNKSVSISKECRTWIIDNSSRQLMPWPIKDNYCRYISLQEAVNFVLEGRSPVGGIQYYRGVIEGHKHPIYDMKSGYGNTVEGQILLEEPVGTCFLIGRQTQSICRTLLVNTGASEDQIKIMDIYGSLDTKSETLIDLNGHRGVISLLKFFECAHLEGQLKICQSVLDTTFLANCSRNQSKKIINQWSLEFLKGIKHITYYDDHCYALIDSIWAYIDQLVYFAKIGRTDIKIHLHQEFLLRVISIKDDRSREIIEYIRQELKGEPLHWALDNYLQMVLGRTWIKKGKLLPPIAISHFHDLYDNEESGSDIRLKFAKSKRVIRAHKVILSSISPMLKHCFNNNNWKVLKEGEYTFNRSADIVEQFAKVAYCIPPDFSNCNAVKIIEFANYTKSDVFMNEANIEFNKTAQSLDCKSLIKLIKLSLWKELPDKSIFFQTLGNRWLEIALQLPEEERDSFRENFLNEYKDYLSEQAGQIMKV